MYRETEHNVQSMLTDIQKIQLVQRYQAGESISTIAKSFGYSYQSCWRLLKRRGIKIRGEGHLSNRKYYFNTHVFDTIDTEAKAYWLGFLYADGCNYEPRYTVILSLATQDEDHVRAFGDFLNLNRPLYRRKNSHGFKGGTGSSALTATDMHFSNRLAQLGVVSAKTFKLTFPTPDQVPPSLVRHFVRGLFDGDGCLTYSKLRGKAEGRLQFSATFVSTKQVLESLMLHLKTQEVHSSMAQRFPNRKNNNYTLSIGGNKNIKRFCAWIYDNSTVFLRRKRERYDMLLKTLNTPWKTKTPIIEYMDGVEQRRWDSQIEAAKFYKVYPSSITSVLSGRRKSLFGRTFKYV